MKQNRQKNVEEGGGEESAIEKEHKCGSTGSVNRGEERSDVCVISKYLFFAFQL